MNRAVQKYHDEKRKESDKTTRESEFGTRQVAKWIWREVRNSYWKKIEELVVYKHQLELDQKKKKALDKHLDYLVGQTEKFSSMLAQDLVTEKPEPKIVPIESVDTQQSNSNVQPAVKDEDEFDPSKVKEEEDDEETMIAAEKEATDVPKGNEEIDLLRKESEIPMEDIIAQYKEALKHEESERTDAGSDSEYESGGDESAGLEYLIGEDDGEEEPDKDATLESASALASAAQPTGITLDTTKVRVQVPPLIKGMKRHTLYKHLSSNIILQAPCVNTNKLVSIGS
jgi:hypothetical protein